MKKFEFETLIIKHPTLNSGYIEFPYNAEVEFGKKGQIKVKVWFDGFLYRGSLVKMGLPCYWVVVNQEVRKAIGKNPGDTVHVVIEKDDDVRVVEIPKDLELLLNENPLAKTKFEKFSYSHKKEWMMWLNDAKKPETRTKRLNKIIEKLLE